MTRAQQSAAKTMDLAIGDWLLTYGWVPEGKRWRHPRLAGAPLCSTHDAYMLTHADPKLGWP